MKEITMTEAQKIQEQRLAEPYQKKIGRITFRVSSYSCSKSTSTAEQLLLDLMADRLLREARQKQ